ncbi:PH domain-containing protein [Nocardioides sp.]|uniref:PH domain-containing protein n=1 Tax=Nocardioides sp. TaxID=35761 RepID=UPI002ED486B5
MTSSSAPGAARRLREPAERVSPRARQMWTVVALANSVFTYGVLLVVALVWDVVPVTWWAAVLIALAFAAYSFLMPRWRYAVHRWEVTETAVYTQTGWWSIEQRIAPMSRIQTVDYEEGAIARLFRLASVTVTTASAAGALQIVGLDRDLARSLVEQLTKRADAVPGDAT